MHLVENNLIIVESFVDMSLNYCITTTKEWVRLNCPELLSKYPQFIRCEDDNDLPVGRFGCPFLEYDKNNVGCHYAREVRDNSGFLYYSIEE